MSWKDTHNKLSEEKKIIIYFEYAPTSFLKNYVYSNIYMYLYNHEGKSLAV